MEENMKKNTFILCAILMAAGLASSGIYAMENEGQGQHPQNTVANHDTKRKEKRRDEKTFRYPNDNQAEFHQALRDSGVCRNLFGNNNDDTDTDNEE